MTESDTTRVCGYDGCERPAGWGRDDMDGEGACKDHVGMADPPEDFSIDKLDEYGGAEIEARNEAKEAEYQDRIDTLNEQQQAAVAGLREHAQESAKTETVPLGQEQLEVRTRFPPRVEQLKEEIEQAQMDGDMERSRRLNAQVAASLVVSPDGYTDPEVWEVAAQEHGMHWLGEAVDAIAGPASENAESLQGNSKDSDGWQKQTAANQSGLHRKP